MFSLTVNLTIWDGGMFLWRARGLDRMHTSRTKRALRRLELGMPLTDAKQCMCHCNGAIAPVNVIGPAADNVLPSVVAASSVASPQSQLKCTHSRLYCYMKLEDPSPSVGMTCGRNTWKKTEFLFMCRHAVRWHSNSIQMVDLHRVQVICSPSQWTWRFGMVGCFFDVLVVWTTCIH